MGAALSLGYIALFHKHLDLDRVLPALHRAQEDPAIRSTVDDSLDLERFQDRCAQSIFNARSPLLGVGSTWVYALGYSNPETAIIAQNLGLDVTRHSEES